MSAEPAASSSFAQSSSLIRRQAPEASYEVSWPSLSSTNVPGAGGFTCTGLPNAKSLAESASVDALSAVWPVISSRWTSPSRPTYAESRSPRYSLPPVSRASDEPTTGLL